MRPRRHGQVVFADSSADVAVRRGCGSKLRMFLPPPPSQPCAPPQARSRRAGYMAVALHAADLGGRKVSPLDVQDYCGRVCAERLLVVVDTGSEGFWVDDDTGGPGTAPFLEHFGLASADARKAFVFSLGERGGVFDLGLPPEWLRLAGSSVLRGPRKSAGGPRTQTLFLGNAWLQAVALTFNCSRRTVVVSHLDGLGRRCEGFQGPAASFGRSSQESKYNAPPLLGGFDVCVDLRFMTAVPAGTLDDRGGTVLRIETDACDAVTEPFLDATLALPGGDAFVLISQTFDTGSGYSLVELEAFEEVRGPGPAPECLGAGTVADVFYRATGSGRVRRCASEGEAGDDRGCSDVCCLAEDTEATTAMRCSVSYCNGLLSYEPAFASLSFPLEHEGDRLESTVAFLGKAKARCVPAPREGVWGCWFWEGPTEGETPVEGYRGSLPGYVLRRLGLQGGDLANFTYKAWRTDLNRNSERSVVVGRPPLSQEARQQAATAKPRRRLKPSPGIPPSSGWPFWTLPATAAVVLVVLALIIAAMELGM